MPAYFITGRAALDDAVALVEQFGIEAPLEAALRANRSRDLGNVRHFCHWRQIERLTELLAADRIEGAIH